MARLSACQAQVVQRKSYQLKRGCDVRFRSIFVLLQCTTKPSSSYSSYFGSPYQSILINHAETTSSFALLGNWSSPAAGMGFQYTRYVCYLYIHDIIIGLPPAV